MSLITQILQYVKKCLEFCHENQKIYDKKYFQKLFALLSKQWVKLILSLDLSLRIIWKILLSLMYVTHFLYFISDMLSKIFVYFKQI